MPGRSTHIKDIHAPADSLPAPRFRRKRRPADAIRNNARAAKKRVEKHRLIWYNQGDICISVIGGQYAAA